MHTPKVSIIVRTKNEKFWILKCLNEIYGQTYKNFEVILVDNGSNDGTVSLVRKQFPLAKIIKYNSKNFFPGKALNLGIKKSKGNLIAMISGHCIPKNNNWLKYLVKNFKGKKIAACYGRQEPLDISDPNDIRDLTYLFGLDKKIQTKDPFFHNANSMIRKSLWRNNNFDENVKHIEDRLWASQILRKKFKIIYEPLASVIHFHGVSHHGNVKRVNTISKMLKEAKPNSKIKNIIALIPILKPVKMYDEYIINKTINDLIKVKTIKKIFVSSNDKNLKKYIKNKKIIFLNRDEDLKKDYLGIEYILSKIYRRHIKNFNPTHILVAEEIYLNRPKNFFKKLIESYDSDFESIVPIVKNPNQNILKRNSKGEIEPIFKTSLPSSFVRHEIFEEVKGLGTLTRAETFEVSGRETTIRKLVEVNRKHAITTKDIPNLKFIKK